MKKLRNCLLFLLLLALLCPVTVFAHPGKTDSNGGHTDHSTGEYHYHHNQPAHAHWDMDNDGDIDCPYNFATDPEQNTHNPSPTGNFTFKNSYGSEDKNSNKKSNGSQKNDNNTLNLLGFLIILIGVPLAYIIYCVIKHLIRIMRAHRTSRKALAQLGLKKIKLPHRVFLSDTYDVSEGLPDEEKPYGALTIYTSKYGRRYHVRRKCNGSNIPGNLYEVPMWILPCKKCAKTRQHPIDVPEWYVEIKNAVISATPTPKTSL